jgi:hypothetical protein
VVRQEVTTGQDSFWFCSPAEAAATVVDERLVLEGSTDEDR